MRQEFPTLCPVGEDPRRNGVGFPSVEKVSSFTEFCNKRIKEITEEQPRYSHRSSRRNRGTHHSHRHGFSTTIRQSLFLLFIAKKFIFSVIEKRTNSTQSRSSVP